MSLTQSKGPAPIEVLRKQLSASLPQFAMALPSHVKPEKFQRVVMTVAQQNPELLEADRRSLLGACLKCAADGLIPDGRDAALVIFNQKSKQGGWEKRVQYMPMLAGLLKRVRNSGEVASVTAQVVYSGDRFVWRPSEDKPIEHETPPLGEERGQPIGAYAIARLKDGSIVCEVMPMSEIEKVRNVSRSKDSGPWVQWKEEMMRKTCFRRLSKWLPMDAEDSEVMARMSSRDDALGSPTGDADAAPIIEGEAVEGNGKLDQLEQSLALEGEIVDQSEKVPA